MKRCRHIWKVVSKETCPSLAELATSAGTNIESDGATLAAAERLFRKQLLVHYRCDSCGTEEVKRV